MAMSKGDYRDLLKQKAELDRKIAAAMKEARPLALTEARDLIEQFSLTEKELFGPTAAKTDGRGKGPRSPAVAKYRDPETGAEWSGRGKPPRWIAGQDRELFLIPA